MKGKFIVVEGLEGAGKTNAHNIVVEELKAHQITQIEFTREPGGTPLAEKLRQLIKLGVEGERVTDKAEVLMIYAARIQLIENIIKPALAKGHWVVGDRHDLSSQAYQGGGRQIDVHLMQTLRDTVLGDFYPDLTLYLDIDPQIGLQRARQRGELDRIEKESLQFFQRTRQRYLELAEQDRRIITIDASQPLDKVSDDIRQSVRLWLQEHNR